jgi:hypothetical protein
MELGYGRLGSRLLETGTPHGATGTEKTSNMKTTSWRRLRSRDERAQAKLALIARNDTVFGGAKAMVVARRLKNMGSQLDLEGIVSDVYSASDWTVTPRWMALECPECGMVHLGMEAAQECCRE